MIQPRHLRGFMVADEMVAEWFRSSPSRFLITTGGDMDLDGNWVEFPLDAKFVWSYWDQEKRSLVLVFEHPEFPPVHASESIQVFSIATVECNDHSRRIARCSIGSSD